MTDAIHPSHSIPPLRRILVGLAAQADVAGKARYALDLARHNDASITLLAVSDVDRLKSLGPVPIGAYHHAEMMRENRINKSHEECQESIDTFLELAKEYDVPIRVIKSDDDPLDAVASAWRHHDLTLLGLKGWFDHAILGEPKNALYKVIEKGIRPVLAVPTDYREIKNVVVAYNGSMESAKTMKQFVRFRLWHDAKLHVVCIGEPETEEPADLLLEEAALLCRSHGYEVDTYHLHGDTTEVLDSHLVSEMADCMVLGGGYRRILTLRRFGPHVLHMVQRGDLPLFISH